MSNLRRRLISGFIVAWVVVQLALPLGALIMRGGNVDSVMMGWQMYSDLGVDEDYFSVWADGTEDPVAWREVAYRVRADTNLHPALTDWLCDREPELVAVIEREADGTDMVRACPR